MQRYLTLLICLGTLALGSACNSGKKLPDVSNIPMSVSLSRFDSAFFRIDTNNTVAGIRELQQHYPVFMPLYISEILNLGSIRDSVNTPKQLRLFLTTPDFRALESSVQAKFKNRDLTGQLEQAFRYTKYYIPSFHPPKIITFISGIANYGAITIDSILGIGLDMYMGADFPPYSQIPDYPAYMIRRFDPAYIPVNSMQVIQQQLYPAAKNSNLLEQMIEAGKQQYFLDKVLPATADTMKLGYTKEQLDWCFDNEQMIWQFFVQNNLLYSTDWQDINHFVNDGPSTQGMPEGSPGKIGSFVGWQIVKKYMEKHPEISLQQLMESKNLLEIFKAAKYRPK
ncbi:gliding motility lipoprotein GldB [Chitinophaga terrae (ex Kim and Jung 2007)]|uniref:gliding motility lipoprotein GldB n=1 Tax=Chitinophaga terrae (ex Kim and Jung 2007) TaxID=408074 RepID=UPI003F990E29